MSSIESPETTATSEALADRLYGAGEQHSNIASYGNAQSRRKKRKAGTGGLDGLSGQDYCEIMKNITVTVDDETYRQARIKAAERDTSVSALVKQFLTDWATEGSNAERLLQEERALRARVRNFSAFDRLSRDEVHDRRR